jgi:excisionase family DNA binding protein
MRANENPVSAVSAVKTAGAAERLSVTPKTIRSLVKRGLLKPNRSTRHLLFPIEELERFLKA